MALSKAQINWLKKNRPEALKNKKFMAKHNAKPARTTSAKKPAGGGGGWNAKELAWAKKNGVKLGKKTAGGLSANAAYQRITGTAVARSYHH